MGDNPISMHMTVNEAIQRFPASVAVFDRFGIDACCGGSVPIMQAAERHGIDWRALLAELEQVMRKDT